MSLNTDYHVWLTYTAGTGANAVASVGFSTSGTRPTSGTFYAITSVGTATVNPDRVRIGIGNSNTFDWVTDRILVDDVQISDNP